MSDSNFVSRDSCPGCKSVLKQELYSAAFSHPPIRTYLERFYSLVGGIEFETLENVNFVVDECRDCGLVYQRLILNDQYMTKLYEEWINPQSIFRSKVMNRDVNYYLRLAGEIELCIKHLGMKPGELQFLDFAMGWGDWCRMAQAFGCSAMGTELSRTRIEHAKTFGVSVIAWEEIPGHQFDCINAEQVFEHLPNPLETLQYLSQSLKPNGIVKISVPNGWDIKERLKILDWTALKGSKNTLYPISPLEHINCFNHDALVRMAGLSGLTPIPVSAQTGKKRFMDATLRDIFGPGYRMIKKMSGSQEIASTHLFFEERKS